MATENYQLPPAPWRVMEVSWLPLRIELDKPDGENHPVCQLFTRNWVLARALSAVPELLEVVKAVSNLGQLHDLEPNTLNLLVTEARRALKKAGQL